MGRKRKPENDPPPMADPSRDWDGIPRVSLLGFPTAYGQEEVADEKDMEFLLAQQRANDPRFGHGSQAERWALPAYLAELDTAEALLPAAMPPEERRYIERHKRTPFTYLCIEDIAKDVEFLVGMTQRHPLQYSHVGSRGVLRNHNARRQIAQAVAHFELLLPKLREAVKEGDAVKAARIAYSLAIFFYRAETAHVRVGRYDSRYAQYLEDRDNGRRGGKNSGTRAQAKLDASKRYAAIRKTYNAAMRQGMTKGEAVAECCLQHNVGKSTVYSALNSDKHEA